MVALLIILDLQNFTDCLIRFVQDFPLNASRLKTEYHQENCSTFESRTAVQS